MANAWSEFRHHLNFYRIHLLFFTFTPFIFSAIFYAANGQTHINYIDALYNSVSALTVCGLATVDLSSLTGFQQALLFVQSSIGNPVIVSWMMVYIRRRYLAKRFEHIVEAEIANRKTHVERGSKEGSESLPFRRRMSRAFTLRKPLSPVPEGSSDGHTEEEKEEKGKRRFGFPSKKTFRKLRTDMIRRMDDAPKPVAPNGWISEEPVLSPHPRPRAISVSVAELQEKRSRVANSPPRSDIVADSDANAGSSAGPGAPILARSSTLQHGNTRAGVPLGHSLTVEFRTPDRDLRGRRPSRERRPSLMGSTVNQFSRSPTGSRRHSSIVDIVHDDRGYVPPGGVPLARRATTQHTYRSVKSPTYEHNAMNTGYGGFPYPTALLLRLFKKLFPGLERRLVRTMTLPRTQTMSTFPGMNADNNSRKNVSYVSFNAIVGRNSTFHLLTEENLMELGGVEYRALTALLWIIGGYHFATQLISFTIIAPYMSISRWRTDFEPPNLHRYIPPVWYSAFQVVSAYTNSGLSLVDQSMIPFQEAYPLIFVLSFLILAGNTAFLAFHYMVYLEMCFIYLFPSHQTWFLLTVVVMLTVVDWFFFLVLDIGNATFEAIPLGVRFAIGFLQATCVRAAGFATVTLSALAPAVQTLFVMMMYISVYPVAMSVRSTNVYEEKSLGVFDREEEQMDNAEPSLDGPRVSVWGRYLTWHARRQLAFDMWWLCLALFLVCIIERSKIQDETNFQWFTIFTILFELISAYGAVGLSLGVPYANYSFSGAWTPLSKLIIIAVMVRGRHRGLPVAIDRAVMLPFEFNKALGTSDDGEEAPEDGEDNDPGRNLDRGATATDSSEPIPENSLTESPDGSTLTPRASHESHPPQ